ncbi:hypothetical protein [Spirosoma koreense]
MKKAVLLLVVWLWVLPFTKAQVVVGGVDVNKLDIQYIRLMGYDKLTGVMKTSSEAVVWLDIGQGIDFRKSNEFLKPVNDQEPVRFRSVTEVLNYLYKNGWELIEQYQLDPNSFHYYILQRRSSAPTK